MDYLYEKLKTPTRLYIKQCPHCGLKYFGKTTLTDIEKYNGSGKFWLRHIKKYNVTPKHLWNSHWYYDTSIIIFALKFSRLNKIVEDINWANLKEENGLDGGWDNINDGSTQHIERCKKGGFKTQFKEVNQRRKKGLIPYPLQNKVSSDKRNKTILSNNPNFYHEISKSGNEKLSTLMEDEEYRKQHMIKHKNGLPKNHQMGEKNSQYGKKFKFMNNGTKNIKVEISLVESYIEQGYVLGRIKI